MKKAILLLTAVFILNSSISTQHLEPKNAKFMDAKPGEWWRINDNHTFVLDEPDFSYDDWRHIFRNKYSITMHDLMCTVDMVGKYKLVFIIRTVGYLERWKYVKYGKARKGRLKTKYGWVLGTTVENTEKFSMKKARLD